MTSSPFGDRRGGRLHRALVYFGLREDPRRPTEPPRRDDTPRSPSAPPPEPRPLTPRERVLTYFGLVDLGPGSRYGEGVSGRLDADIDDLRRRIAELEAGTRRDD